MDPITIGAFVSTALGIAGEAIVKGTAELAVKDAYAALKTKISSWVSGDDVAALEKSPTSAARQAVIAEAVDALPEADKAEVLPLAHTVADGVPVPLDVLGVAAPATPATPKVSAPATAVPAMILRNMCPPWTCVHHGGAPSPPLGGTAHSEAQI